MKKKNLILMVILSIMVILSNTQTVSATQSRTKNFNKNYSLCTSQAQNMVNIAAAQVGKSKANLGYSEAWCADFVCDCAQLAGISTSVIPREGLCTNLYNRLVKSCGAKEVTSPKAGDLVFYYCSKCKRPWLHVGIYVNKSYSIEGNLIQGKETSKVRKNIYGYNHNHKGVKKIYVRPKYKTVVLSTPGNLKASNATNGVTISWGKVSGAVKYRVFYKKGSGDWTKLTDTTSTSVTSTKLSSGTTYTFTVRCVDATGKNYLSKYNTTGITLKYLRMPNIVTLLRTSDGVTITWNMTKGADRYNVYRKSSVGDSWTKIMTVSGESTLSYTDTSAEKGTTYYYTVRAFSGTTKSAYNNNNGDYI